MRVNRLLLTWVAVLLMSACKVETVRQAAGEYVYNSGDVTATLEIEESSVFKFKVFKEKIEVGTSSGTWYLIDNMIALRDLALIVDCHDVIRIDEPSADAFPSIDSSILGTFIDFCPDGGLLFRKVRS